jgi:NADPH-dependent 2,4-dienoyl-CoA reductase/sulfur reductase-like enzyme
MSQEIRYLIVGGGLAGHAALRALREADPAATVALLSAERHPPYARPPLSKKLWTGDPESSVWLPPAEGARLVLGRRALRLDRAAHEVVDDQGERHRYGKLLLATGGAPRRLPPDDPRIVAYRTLDDFRRVKEAVAAAERRVAVIGGGFIGSEMAAAVRGAGARVTLVFPEAGVCARVFPADLSANVTAYYREKGVEVWAGELVAGIDAAPRGLTVRTKTGRVLEADLAVVGLGIQPSVELAREAGLAVSDGIDVDERLRTSDPDVWAAGDVARFPCAALGIRVRVEHEDAAISMGAFAGHAMAGGSGTYDHLPSFYSDLFDLGYEAVGEVDARHEVVADWKRPFREGVVYYLGGGRVRGVLLWNVWGQVDAARALVAERGPFKAADLRGRIG